MHDEVDILADALSAGIWKNEVLLRLGPELWDWFVQHGQGGRTRVREALEAEQDLGGDPVDEESIDLVIVHQQIWNLVLRHYAQARQEEILAEPQILNIEDDDQVPF